MKIIPLAIVSFGFLVYLIIGIAVFVGVLLILREVNCWYWKINLRIELLQDQNRLLTQIAESLEKTGPTVKPPTPEIAVGTVGAPSETGKTTDQKLHEILNSLPPDTIKNLSEAKIERIAYLIPILGKDEVIVLHDNKIKQMDRSRWKDLENLGDESRSQLIFENV